MNTNYSSRTIIQGENMKRKTYSALLVAIFSMGCASNDSNINSPTQVASNDSNINSPTQVPSNPDSSHSVSNQPKISAPQIYPASGNFEPDTLNISIQSAYAGAEIRYTLDGSEPTKSSSKYTTMISVRMTGAFPINVKSKIWFGLDSSVSTQATYSPFNVPWNSSINFGTFTDTRDNHVYKTVKVGSQTWMAENLNYATSKNTSKCYKDSSVYCERYGRQYTWDAAMNTTNPYTISDSTSIIQGVCPTGWHVPKDTEWNTLVAFVKNSVPESNNISRLNSLQNSVNAVAGWNQFNNAFAYRGTDNFGLRILPGGIGNANEGSAAYFWTSTRLVGGVAKYQSPIFNDNNRKISYREFSNYLSIRCILN